MASQGNRNGSIGVFDSGFGGLDILRCIVAKLPQYHYLYLGDTQRTPYGTRTQGTIYQFSREAVDFLFKRGCELIILACNTASAEALRKIQQEYLPQFFSQNKVLGVIIPAVEAAVGQTKNGKVGIMATEGTVKSGAFEREILRRSPNTRVFQAACPLLVPIVEAGEDSPEIVLPILRKYLVPLFEQGIDTLILGCTHYGLLEKQIRQALRQGLGQVVGEKVSLIVEGEVVAEKLADYLARHSEIEQKLNLAGEVEFFTTDLTDKFQELGSQFFGKPIDPQKVEISDKNG